MYGDLDIWSHQEPMEGLESLCPRVTIHVNAFIVRYRVENIAKKDSVHAGVPQEEARQQYCDLIGSLLEAEGQSAAQEAEPAAGSGAAFKTLLVTTEDNITTIKMNRPAKKNAITTEVCVLFCL